MFPRSGSLEPRCSLWTLLSVVWGSGLSGDQLHTETFEGFLGPQRFTNIQEALTILHIASLRSPVPEIRRREQTPFLFVIFFFFLALGTKPGASCLPGASHCTTELNPEARTYVSCIPVPPRENKHKRQSRLMSKVFLCVTSLVWRGQGRRICCLLRFYSGNCWDFSSAVSPLNKRKGSQALSNSHFPACQTARHCLNWDLLPRSWRWETGCFEINSRGVWGWSLPISLPTFFQTLCYLEVQHVRKAPLCFPCSVYP